MGIFSSSSSSSSTSSSQTSTSTSAKPYKSQFSLEERRAQHAKVTESNPNKIPVILERAPHSSVPEIDKTKYLVPVELTVAQFLFLVRKRIQLSNDQALFIYLDGQIPAASAIFSTLYEDSKDEDGFLYIVYTGETSFGK